MSPSAGCWESSEAQLSAAAAQAQDQHLPAAADSSSCCSHVPELGQSDCCGHRCIRFDALLKLLLFSHTMLFLVSSIHSDVVIAQAPSYIGTAVCNTIVAGRTNYAFTAQRTQPSLTEMFNIGYFAAELKCSDSPTPPPGQDDGSTVVQALGFWVGWRNALGNFEGNGVSPSHTLLDLTTRAGCLGLAVAGGH
eukprot:18265-Heterococcus_DN1.PRE.1